MGGTTASTTLSFVLPEVRAELTRLGLVKEDFERRGVSVDDLDREVLRRFRERGHGPIAGIVGEILARVHLG